jgi:hypothetical protein
MLDRTRVAAAIKLSRQPIKEVVSSIDAYSRVEQSAFYGNCLTTELIVNLRILHDARKSKRLDQPRNCDAQPLPRPFDFARAPSKRMLNLVNREFEWIVSKHGVR